MLDSVYSMKNLINYRKTQTKIKIKKPTQINIQKKITTKTLFEIRAKALLIKIKK